MDKNLVKDLVIIPTRIIRDLYKSPGGNDAVALYMFYYYTALFQSEKFGKLNRIYATGSFCRKHFGWREQRFWKADKLLRDKELITKIREKDERGIVISNYVQVNFLWTKKSFENFTTTSHGKQSTTSQNPQLPMGSTNTNGTNEFINTNGTAKDKSFALLPNQTGLEKEALPPPAKRLSIVDTLLVSFAPVNPAYLQFFENKSQRAAIAWLVENVGFEKVKAALELLPYLQKESERFSVDITTPIELKNKFGKLRTEISRMKNGMGMNEWLVFKMEHPELLALLRQ